MKKINIDYHDQDTLLEGFYCYDDKNTQKRPGILIFHDWSGRTQFPCEKAERLAELGFVGFAVDMYGKGKTGKTTEEKQALMMPVLDNRRQLQQRTLAAFDALKKLDIVDPHRMGAMGYCFGGLCALDLARAGADVKGVVSFHGNLTPPPFAQTAKIIAKVLALHGYDDPMVGHEQLTAFGDEMTKANVDWELDIYGHTMHAFTNPEANDPGFGTVYRKEADLRSWHAMKHFFAEVFQVPLS